MPRTQQFAHQGLPTDLERHANAWNMQPRVAQHVIGEIAADVA